MRNLLLVDMSVTFGCFVGIVCVGMRPGGLMCGVIPLPSLVWLGAVSLVVWTARLVMRSVMLSYVPDFWSIVAGQFGDVLPIHL